MLHKVRIALFMFNEKNVDKVKIAPGIKISEMAFITIS